MNRKRLTLRSLSFYWRTNLAVLLGLAAATAVMAGALIVGDSVRGSLRRMTLERLGKIDYALVANRFFPETLAERMNADAGFSAFGEATPAILLTAVADNAETGARARDVNLIGATRNFWSLSGENDENAVPAMFAEAAQIEGRNAAVNLRLANELGIAPGDAILIRLERPDPIPTEAVFGRRRDNSLTLRLNVAAVVPNESLGRFGLTPSQQLPFNVFVPLDALQEGIEQAGAVNAIFVAASGDRDPAVADKSEELQRHLDRNAGLGDLGLRLRLNDAPGYLSLESARMVLRESDAHAALAVAREEGIDAEPTLTYLANSIAIGEREIPYSTVTALHADAEPPLGPLLLIGDEPAPALGERDILLNEWAALDLGARIGDKVSLTYYETGPVGQFETSRADDFTLRGVVAMKGLGADSGLTPEYPGVSDARSVRDWDPPFPMDLGKIREVDERYWDDYRATPKAFISLETGVKLWTSRFGRYTSIRFAPAPDRTPLETRDLLERRLVEAIPPSAAGLVFQPVKKRGLEASRGAADFGMLFIGFSLFIIVSAMLLIRLLFALGVEHRAREIGLLLAAGFTPRQVRRRFLIEGMALAAVGGLLGLAMAVGYAWLMLYGLRTWWVESIGTTFLWLFLRPESLAAGLVFGLAAGAISLYSAARSLTRVDPLRLLSGGSVYGRLGGEAARERAVRRDRGLAVAAGTLAVVLIVVSTQADTGAQAALFYGSGAALLTAALAGLSALLRRGPGGGVRPGGFSPVGRLGARNAARHHGRSVLTAALVASATFIIIAVAANRHDPASAQIEKHSGNGGFALMAASGAPVLDSLNAAQTRAELNLNESQAAAFEETTIYPMRLSEGQDASCLNLYRPSRPRILGAPAAMIERGGFKFQASLAQTPAESENPWLLLRRETDGGAVPAVGDYNTVVWILQSGLGRELTIVDDLGRRHRLKIVALLKGSALQSELIVSEENFIEMFPEVSGYRYFLIDAPPAQSEEVRAALESGLREKGFDAFPTRERLAAYFAVENTYLSTFQALGGLGLLLGTLGLAAVMLRNVLERRGELALLHAVGYRRSALAFVVLAENAFLLVAGVAIGAAAALLSVAPSLLARTTDVPWLSLLLTFAVILGVGMTAGAAAVTAALRTPMIQALRSP